MNSLHDCGGIDGFGPVVGPNYCPETEPTFKEEWERRMFAVFIATIVGGMFNDDEFRQSRERLDPERYLTRDYYEQWYFAVQRLLLEKAVVEPAELVAMLETIKQENGQ